MIQGRCYLFDLFRLPLIGGGGGGGWWWVYYQFETGVFWDFSISIIELRFFLEDILFHCVHSLFIYSLCSYSRLKDESKGVGYILGGLR